jgi:LPS-assembly protein
MALITLAIMPANMHAEPSPVSSSSSPDSQEAWNIEADRLTFYHESGVIMGQGDVRVHRGDMRVYADYLIYDRANATIYASGHVVIHMKNDVIKGTEGKLDLNTRTGEIAGANLFLQRNNVYVTADRITKTGPEEYEAEDATISTCALPDQAWRIRARDLKLTVNGDAVAKNTTFDVQDIPVFYTPWAVVPLNKYRKSGVLIPGYTSSKRNGFGFYVPLYLVLNDSMDMTWYPHYMTKRGFMQGFEYRHNFSDEDVAVFRYNFLYDQETDNDYNNDGYTRGNSFRWWIRGKINQNLPFGFKAKLDLDMISDRDYLNEFETGETSFNASNLVFKKYFHRSLAYRTDVIRPSKVQVTRNFDDAFLAGMARYNDNHDTGQRKYTVQTLPSLVAKGFKQRLFNTPLYFEYDLDFTNYWRETGTRESRFNINPAIMMPVNIFNWADVVFNAGLINTSYWTGGESDIMDPKDTNNRLMYRLTADASKTFGSTFHAGSSSVLNHTIRPRLLYELQPAVKQDDLPYIDSFDRLPQRSRLSISLLSYLSSRSRNDSGQYTYKDLVRLDLVQRFNFIKEPLYNIPTLKDNYAQSMSEFYTELEIKPCSWFYMRYDSLFNHYTSQFTTHNVTANMSSAMGDRLNINYRYNRLTDINQIGINMTAALLPSVFFSFNINQNFQANTEIQSSYGLLYQGSCWTLSGSLSNNRDDTSIMFNVGLKGIGSTAGLGGLGM